MAAILHQLDQGRLIDSNGIADGGQILFYVTETLTPAPVYTTAALNVEHSSPIVVAAGAKVPAIYLDSSVTYRRRIVYPDGSVDDTDPYTGGVALASDLASTDAGKGDDLVATIQSGAGAVARTVRDKLREAVSITDFGATTASADNKVAIEAAITAAMAGGRHVIIPPGVFNFSQLDLGSNPADDATRLIISGPGTLHTTYNGFAFIASGGKFHDLIIDRVSFTSVVGSGTKLFDGDTFYRLVLTPGTQFRNFDWVVYGEDYLQSLRMIGCIIRGGYPPGAVVKAPMAYDTEISQNIIEYVWDGIVIDGPGIACNRVNISNNCIEGIGNRAIVLGATLATAVCDNYLEGNSIGDIFLNAGSDAHLGLRVQGNKIELSSARLAQGRGSFTGSITGNTLTVTSVDYGTIAVGDNIYGTGIIPGTIIGALGTGTGGTGTYVIANAQEVASTTISKGGFGIVWGSSTQSPARAGGNQCTGALHETTGVTAIIDMAGDFSGTGELYTNYQIENVSGRDPRGWATYASDTVWYAAVNDRYLGLDGFRQELRFGGKYDSTVSGTEEPLVICFGTNSPEADPSQFDRAKWAKGSIVFNANPVSAGAGYWVCLTAGSPGTWSYNAVLP